MPDPRPETRPPLGAGLCERCRHARIVASARSRFLRCGLSDTDPRFDRYPGLPVIRCWGFEAPLTGSDSAD